MNAHPEANNQDSTIADQLDALFEESRKLTAEWSRIYHTPSGRPRKRLTESQVRKLDANYERGKEITAQILALMKEVEK